MQCTKSKEGLNGHNVYTIEYSCVRKRKTKKDGFTFYAASLLKEARPGSLGIISPTAHLQNTAAA